MATVCDLCGKRIPDDFRRELFAGIDGTLFHFAQECGEPIDTCADCHGAVRTEVKYRLACAREDRMAERERSMSGRIA